MLFCTISSLTSIQYDRNLWSVVLRWCIDVYRIKSTKYSHTSIKILGRIQHTDRKKQSFSNFTTY